MSAETVALGRSKRSTAGNRMRELLEKAHQEDQDELFKEAEDDEDFEAPAEQRDVFLEDFADTDDEVEMDEEEMEKQAQREERRKAKGKAKQMYNPLAVASRSKPSASAQRASALASSSAVTLLDPSIDVDNMAPSTLILTLRKQRREAKRQQRSEARRSNLRASTLKTEQEVLAKEQQAAAGGPSRKGRRAQHEGGEVRGVRPMTQDELIAQALEEEERNKEELRTWLRREEEKRELRRVGRKVVRGPKWTWVSRTVGKLVEVVEDANGPEATRKEPPPDQPDMPPVKQVEKAPDSAAATAGAEPVNPTGEQSDERPGATPVPEPADPPNEPLGATEARSTISAPNTAAASPANPPVSAPTPDGEVTARAGSQPSEPTNAKDLPATIDHTRPEEAVKVPTVTEGTPAPPADAGTAAMPSEKPAQIPPKSDRPGPEDASSSKQPTDQAISASNAALRSDPDPAAPVEDAPTGPYARNYLMLSQVAGGLASELKIILGDHVDWDDVKYIPARNRPMTKRPAMCPFTGRPAKYRHPGTMIPYATPEGYKQIEALLQQRYWWNAEANCWFGGEADVWAEGMDGIDGRAEAVNGGWWEGKPLPEPEPAPTPEQEGPDVEMERTEAGERGAEEANAVPSGKKRKAAATNRGKGRKRPSVLAAEDAVIDAEIVSSPIAAASSSVPSKKSKGRARASRR